MTVLLRVKTPMQTDVRKQRTALMLTQQEFGEAIGMQREMVKYVETSGKYTKDIPLQFNERTGVQLIRLAKFQSIFIASGLTQSEFAPLVGMAQSHLPPYLRYKIRMSDAVWQRVLTMLGIPEPATTPEIMQKAEKVYRSKLGLL